MTQVRNADCSIVFRYRTKLYVDDEPWRIRDGPAADPPQWKRTTAGGSRQQSPSRSAPQPLRASGNALWLIGIFRSSYDNVLKWMPTNVTYDKSTFLQVKAWCRQATRHSLNQCWSRSATPWCHRPQWVKFVYRTSAYFMTEGYL